MVLVIIFPLVPIISQDYKKHKQYFNGQKELCQKIIEPLEYLKVDRILVYKSLISLELILNTSQDSSTFVWENLKSSFSKTNPISLEKWIFIKMAYTIDVPYEHLKIRIYNESEDGDSNVDGRILFEKGQIKTEGFSSLTKVEETLELKNFDINSLFFKTLDSIPIKLSEGQKKHKLYQKIKEKAEQYFTSQPGAVEFKSPYAEPLVFNVKNIKNEVVPANASWLSVPNPYERLNFIISLNIDEEDQTLSCEIELDGKYGSGLWIFRPTRTSHYIEMEPKYIRDLENYIKFEFQPLLYYWLTND